MAGNDHGKELESQGRTTSMEQDVSAFVEFAKIPRLSREIVVTEKIDGTNAHVHVLEDGTVLAASRTRYVTPDDDNFGFARWVKEHEDDLRTLGPGRHYGEWWGGKIQRGYGLQTKRFSLFNVAKWSDARPLCCDVVPVLYRGPFDTAEIDRVLEALAANGSMAAPGFMRPEGVVIFHTAGHLMFKKTIEKDAEPKSKVTA